MGFPISGFLRRKKAFHVWVVSQSEILNLLSKPNISSCVVQLCAHAGGHDQPGTPFEDPVVAGQCCFSFRSGFAPCIEAIPQLRRSQLYCSATHLLPRLGSPLAGDAITCHGFEFMRCRRERAVTKPQMALAEGARRLQKPLFYRPRALRLSFLQRQIQSHITRRT